MDKDRILVITSYPPEGTLYGKGVGGLASFAKNTLKSVKESEFTVLAEILDQRSTYREGKVEVKRVWKRGSLSLYPKLINQLIRSRSSHSTLMIQFEFGIYGSEYVTGFFPIVTWLARLLGYKLVVVQHQVISNLSDLSPHIGSDPNSIPTKIKNLLMQLYYLFLLLPASKIVVFDQVHADKLRSKIGQQKEVSVIPHAAEEYFNQSATRQYRNETSFKLMTFGFIAWYKGTDWLVDQFNEYCSNNPSSKLTLTVAGGESPTQKGKEGYQKFFTNFKGSLDKNQKVSWTGFIDEADIPETFLNADIVILPYRVLMSSSGPLSLALTYGRPFVFSEQLAPYTETSDFKALLEELQIDTSEFVFSLDDNSLFEKIEKVRSEPDLYSKLTQLSERLGETRSWSKTGIKYQKVLKA